MKYELLNSLLSFNTVGDLENIKIMDFLKTYLVNLGFQVEEIWDCDKKKKCIVASFGTCFGLSFLGHTDTVAADGWDKEAFKLTYQDGKLYGLGSCDMKGGISAFLEAISEIDLDELTKGIQIVLTFDEETNFQGIKLITENNIKLSDNVIVGEPTDLVPVIATKGCIEYKVICRGVSSHSSNPIAGDNAINKCVKVINELNKFYEKLKLEKNELFEIPYTTMNIAKISGGTNINVVPNYCEVSFDFRTVYKKQYSQIEKKINSLRKKYGVEIVCITKLDPLENSGRENEYFEKLTNKKVSCFNYVTEASFLDSGNVVILGPGPNMAHEKDEFIFEESYLKTIDIYKEMISKYCIEK